MIADAKSGKLDIILVKSVSRFSRNVGECQRYVDILRANNVTVIFERENIHSDDFTSNFALALIGATAQDESHSISENRRWAYQKQYAEGKYNMGNNRTVLVFLVVHEQLFHISKALRRGLAGEAGRLGDVATGVALVNRPVHQGGNNETDGAGDHDRGQNDNTFLAFHDSMILIVLLNFLLQM